MKLFEKITIYNKTVENRILFQPMEGSNFTSSGAPTEASRNKYLKFASSGAGIVWMEAAAVCHEGRASYNQMLINEFTYDEIKQLIDDMKEISFKNNGFVPELIIQLNHSGRQSKPMPIIADHNIYLEEKRPVSDDSIADTEYLDKLPEKYYDAAKLCSQIGFDGVDIKCCHGYLLNEFNSAYFRKDKYGGCFENRTRLFFNCVDAAKSAVNKSYITTRLGVYDGYNYPFGFGIDKNNNLDLTEAKKIIKILHDKFGIELINITLGNPYVCPHVNRPFTKGGYLPPEDIETGLKRFEYVNKNLKSEFPDLKFVMSALSNYMEKSVERAENLLQNNVADIAGFGRLAIAYPEFPNDLKRNGYLERKKCCVTCSKCAELLRAGLPSGCMVHDEFYSKIYKENFIRGKI